MPLLAGRDAFAAVPASPAFVRPVDIVTGPAIQPETFGNTFDGRPYHPA